MADIINLADRRKKEQPTPAAIIEAAAAYIGADWEKFAKSNRLNDYFIEAAGVWTEEGINYLADLNALSSIESKVGMCIVVRAPFGPHIGWTAGFNLKTATAFSPDMPFETYARAFSVLLFLKVKRDLIANGYFDEV